MPNYINPHAQRLQSLAVNLGCQELAAGVLDNPRFPLWAGASKPHQHHYGKGRLAEHVLEVAEISLTNNEYFERIGKGVDKVKLFLAALFHDAGKMWDYEPVDMTYEHWRSTEHKNLIHHISRSGLAWCMAAQDADWKPVDIDEVWHCILSHHGVREWGSPVAPQTRMAWLLHLADGMSARLDDYDKRLPFSLDAKPPIK